MSPSHDVEQLRQFVEAGFTQEAADAGDALVVLAGVFDDVAVLGHRHGAELHDPEHLAALAGAALAEQDRTRRFQGDGDGDGDQGGRQDDQGREGAAVTSNRRLRIIDRRRRAEIDGAPPGTERSDGKWDADRTTSCRTCPSIPLLNAPKPVTDMLSDEEWCSARRIPQAHEKNEGMLQLRAHLNHSKAAEKTGIFSLPSQFWNAVRNRRNAVGPRKVNDREPPA
jgi:hypothetical protein